MLTGLVVSLLPTPIPTALVPFAVAGAALPAFNFVVTVVWFIKFKSGIVCKSEGDPRLHLRLLAAADTAPPLLESRRLLMSCGRLRGHIQKDAPTDRMVGGLLRLLLHLLRLLADISGRRERPWACGVVGGPPRRATRPGIRPPLEDLCPAPQQLRRSQADGGAGARLGLAQQQPAGSEPAGGGGALRASLRGELRAAAGT